MTDVGGGLAAILIENVSPTNVLTKIRDNIDLILSGGRLMRELEKSYANVPNAEQIMKKRFEKVTDYDVILIDCPPALSLISSAVSVYAHYVIIPCSPDLLAFVGVKNTSAFLESLQTHMKKDGVEVAKLLGIVPTMFDHRRSLDNEIHDDLIRQVDAALLVDKPVIFKPIRADHKVKTSQVKRRLLSETFKNSNAYQDYVALGDSVLEAIRKIEAEKTGRKEVPTLETQPSI